MNGRRTEGSAGQAVRRNAVDLIHDVTALVDLQGQLFVVDVQEAQRRSIAPAIAMLSGLVLSLGAIPVLLLGLGWFLIEEAGWTAGWSFLTVGAAAVVIAVALLWGGWKLLRAAASTLSRSKEELMTNIRWIQTVLKNSGSAT